VTDIEKDQISTINKVIYKWFTEVCYEGKPMTGIR